MSYKFVSSNKFEVQVQPNPFLQPRFRKFGRASKNFQTRRRPGGTGWSRAPTGRRGPTQSRGRATSSSRVRHSRRRLVWPPPATQLNVILERCKGVHCVDLGESFRTHFYLQNLVSIQPKTSPVKFARSTPPGWKPGMSSARSSCPVSQRVHLTRRTKLVQLHPLCLRFLQSRSAVPKWLPGRLSGTRARLCPSRCLQVNMRLKFAAFFNRYKICTAPNSIF